MIWSFSAHRNFQKCPRQWFYKSVVANAKANDAFRREAYRLSKLEGIQAWRGKVVDAVISEIIIPSIVRRRPCGLTEAREAAKKLFQQQRMERTNRQLGRESSTDNGDKGSFMELEYGLAITDDMFAQAWVDVELALDNFYNSESVWQELPQADRLIPQRPLSFKHGEVTVRSVPDLIVFYPNRSPAIYDWKVNTRQLRDYWPQLVTGALALTRCTPHRDWAVNSTHFPPQDIQLLEVQLLARDVRIHTLSEADIYEAENLIAISAMEMKLACGDKDTKKLQPDEFPAARDPKICEMCPFRKICW